MFACSICCCADATVSSDAKEIYDSIYSNIKATILKSLKSEAEIAFYAKDYTKAIETYTKALEMNDSDYDVLNFLAHSYRLDEQYDKAVEVFQMIVEKFPGKRAKSAQKYIDNGGKGFDTVEQTSGGDQTTTTTGESSGQSGEAAGSVGANQGEGQTE